MKKILLLLTVWLSLSATAQTQWCVVATAAPDTPLAAMDNVAFFLTSDHKPALTIVCKDGRLIGDVASISFRQLDPTALPTVKGSQPVPQVYGDTVAGQLLLRGCPEGAAISLFDLSGRQLRQLKARGAEQTLDVSGLPTGTYILKVGSVTLKFMKR